MSSYPKNRLDDKLSKRELGRLLGIIADALSREKDVQKIDLQNFFDKLDFYGPRLDSFAARTDDTLYQCVEYLNMFRTNEQLREFLQVVYRKRIPSRLSKENLRYLGLGIMLSSNLSIQKATEQWNKRNAIVRSRDIYKIARDELIQFLSDNSIFPDGYSIVAYAKEFHIILPRIKDRNRLISILLEKLFDRPLSSKEIGRWGLSKRGKRSI